MFPPVPGYGREPVGNGHAAAGLSAGCALAIVAAELAAGRAVFAFFFFLLTAFFLPAFFCFFFFPDDLFFFFFFPPFFAFFFAILKSP